MYFCMEAASTNYYVVKCLIVVKQPVHSSLGVVTFRRGLHYNNARPGFAHVYFLFLAV